jgi:hypothetical protein
MEKYLPSFEEINKAFSYDSQTGIFTRKIRTANCSKIGDVAGHINTQGYVIIKYLGEAYKAHRLAWLLTNKVWPAGDVDHIDGNKSNNAIYNLRDVSRSRNALNTSIKSKNKSGYKGVSIHNGRWRARIMLDGKSIIIGSYTTPEEASAAYNEYKKNNI